MKAPALQHRESAPVYGEFALSAMLAEFDRIMARVELRLGPPQLKEPIEPGR